ncbi:unnamed protein product, partial [Laminaria digitata]
CCVAAKTASVIMNLFRFGGDMAHLAAIVLLPFKLHASRSAAGDTARLLLL